MEKHIMDLAIERKVVIKEIPVEGALMKRENRRRNGSFMAASTIIWNWIQRDGCVN